MTDRNAPPLRALAGACVVAYDGTRHRILDRGCVAWRGGRIEHVGPELPASVDEVVDAAGRLVIPGLISTHAHVGTHAGDRLVLDNGRRDLQRTGFLNYQARPRGRAPVAEGAGTVRAASRFGFAALLKGGVTTVLDMGSGTPETAHEVVEAAGEAGIRLYYGPCVRSAEWVCDERGRVERLWNPGEGLAALAAAVASARALDGSHGGRVRGAVVVDELFTATPELLRAAKAAADQAGLPLTLHAAEQVYEFQNVLRTTGRTPVGWLSDLGVLGPNVVLGHCLYVGGHSMAAYPYDDDLALLAASGATVAHSPLAVARRGTLLESFDRYRAQGVRLALGTDSYPQDMLAEMQYASMLGKVARRDHEAASAAHVFDAATLGGAAALGRDDLGRIAPGARADLVVLDMHDLRFGPVFDPIRALLHCSTSDLVRTVVVDGRIVVEDGEPTWAGTSALVAGAQAACDAYWAAMPDRHWSGRDAASLFPDAFAPWPDTSPMQAASAAART